ncbi:MAG: NACHT domain-containing protein [Pseudomonadota bacterium]
MTHSFYEHYQNTLRQEVPPVCWPLLQAVFDCEPHEGEEPGVSLANKQAVLAQLADREGAVPDAAVIRKRIQRINEAVRDIPTGDHLPLLRLISTKQAFRIEWHQQALQQQEMSGLKAQVSADSVRATPHEAVEPAMQKPPEYQVFISHAWENESIEGYLDEFVGCLEQKLKSCQGFTTKVWFDRRDMRGNINRMADQYLPAARDSDFALFMTSEKWCRSEDCQREATEFYRRPGPEDHRPYCVIQLIDSHDDLDKPYRTIPNYPKFWVEDYAHLTYLWELESETIKNDFVREIRDQICQYFRTVQPPPKKTRRQKSVSLRDFACCHLSGNLDLAPHRTIETRIQPNKDDDTTTTDTIPAVQTLFDWVCTATPAYRTTVLLGGFGMGKTVTVQLLAQKLHDARQQNDAIPTPVYLDFRRLIPQTRHGEAVTTGIDELIFIALDPEHTEHNRAGQLRDLIRAEPCVVIFDGLDEIGNRIGREHAVQLYRRFLELIPIDVRQTEARAKTADYSVCPTRLLLTCRTHFFRDLREQEGFFAGAHRSHSGSNRYQEYHMAPLSLDKIQELFQQYLGAEQGAQAFELIQNIHDLPGLAKRPIMARFITEIVDELIQRHQQGLPINIATVYDELFHSGIERDQEKDPLLTKQDRKQILIALAAHLQQHALQHLAADDLESWFDTFAHTHAGIRHLLSSQHINARNLLHTELENASFLVRDNADKFRFAHTSFFEYFLAEALLQALPDQHQLARLSHHTISRETRQFVLAIARSNNTQVELQHGINQILCAETAVEARLFCLRMQQELHPDHTLPQGANLSGLDLRGLDMTGADTPITWQQVNLSAAWLNRWQAERIHFRACNFQQTQLANATFDHCTFTDCQGMPQGLVSARGSGTELPAPWQIQLARGSASERQQIQQHWQNIPLGQVVNIPTRTRFTAVAYSPDGSFAISGSEDGTVRQWDLATGAEIRCLTGHAGRVCSVAYSPDGQLVLSGSADGAVRQWDLATGAEIRCLQGHTKSVWSVAYSGDGRFALSGSSDGTVRQWDLVTGAEIRSLQGHTDWVRSVVVSPDGGTIFSCGDDRTVRQWDLSTGIEICCLKGHTESVCNVTISSDGNTVLSGSVDGTVRQWDLATGAEICYFKGDIDVAYDVAFSPDGRTAFSGCSDSTMRQWDLATGTEIRCFTGHKGPVVKVTISLDGNTVLSGSIDNTMRQWDLATGEEMCCLKSHLVSVNSVITGSDSHAVLSDSYDGTVRLWELTARGKIGRLQNYAGWIYRLAISPDGQNALGSSDDGKVHQLKLATRIELDCLKGYTGWARSAAYTLDGQVALSSSCDGKIYQWDLATGAEICCLTGHTGRVTNVLYSSDGHTVLSGSEDGTVRQWDLATRAEIRCLQGHTRAVSSVVISPDDETALSGSADGTVRQWDLATGVEIRCLRGHTRSVNSVSISPDDETALSGSADGTVRQWDLATGTLRAIHYVLPDAWAMCDAQHRLLNQGGKLWKYAAVRTAT